MEKIKVVQIVTSVEKRFDDWNYTGTLCVQSNDPVNSALGVDLTLAIDVPMDVNLSSFRAHGLTGWVTVMAGVAEVADTYEQVCTKSG